jgi:hypothetical protein
VWCGADYLDLLLIYPGLAGFELIYLIFYYSLIHLGSLRLLNVESEGWSFLEPFKNAV